MHELNPNETWERGTGGKQDPFGEPLGERGARGRSRGCSGLWLWPPDALGPDLGGGVAPGASPPGTRVGAGRFSASTLLWMCCIPPGATAVFWGKEAVLQNYICTMPGVTGSWEKPPSITAVKAVVRPSTGAAE